MKAILVVLILIGLAVGGGYYYTTRVAADPPANFRTASVKRGDLSSTISATGTVEAEELVDVGAQVVGPIKFFGIDPTDLAKFKAENKRDPTPAEEKKLKRIDFCSTVQENTILAQIDDVTYQAQVDQADASLKRAQADLLQMKAKLIQADQDWQRAQRLRPDRAAAEKKAAEKEGGAKKPAPENKATSSGASASSTAVSAKETSLPDAVASSEDKIALNYRAMSDSDYDLAKANYEVAVAYVAVGEATINQAYAALKVAKKNLDYTKIRSPVDGTIVARRMNVGQTVVATFSAASLFLIAKDLRRMQVWASVNEADIGRIHSGQAVRFTVDAFSGEVFHGKVIQIRLNAQTNQNVVTYTVVVETENSNLRLLPYLTANLQFELEQRKNVLLVPNAALRWKPRSEQVVPDARATVAASLPGKAGGQWSKGGGEGGKGGEGRKGSGQGKKGGAEGGKRGGPSAKPDTPPAKPDGAPGQVAEKSALPGEAKAAKPQKDREDRGRLWVRDGDFVRPIDVQIGATDGSQTEVSGSQVQDDMEVVIGENRKDDIADSGTTNPFMPKLFRGGKKM